MIRHVWPHLPFYLLRANPDGEGDWFTRIDPTLAQKLRQKKTFTPEFAQYLHEAILHRHVPLLVDVGGKITQEQATIVRACTHAILLSSTKEGIRQWRAFVEDKGIPVIAELISDLKGKDSLQATHPILRGTLCCLERTSRARPSPVIEQVGRHVVELIRKALRIRFAPKRGRTPQEERLLIARALVEKHKQQAPIPHVIDVERGTDQWTPDMLPSFAEKLPTHRPVAIYGSAPNWVYGTIAAQTFPQQLVQFDAVLGWIHPPHFRLSSEPHPLLVHRMHPLPTHGIHLSLNFAPPYVPIGALQGATLPPLIADFLLIEGRLSMWMWTALVRTYIHIPRIYLYQPQLNGGVLVHAHDSRSLPGAIYPINLAP